MVRAWIADLRWPSFRSHPAIRFQPIQGNRIVLRPVNDAGFIAPVEQLRHRLQMRPIGHVGSHSILIAPKRHGPICELPVSKQRAVAKAVSALRLPPYPHSVNEELRHKPERADAQPGGADEGHHTPIG